MKNILICTTATLFLLSACSQNDERATTNEAIEAASDSAVSEVEDASGREPSLAAPLPAAMPKLAYAYGLAFELPGPDIGRLIRRHADLCEQQGPASCRIVGMDLSGDSARDDVRGKLQLAVAASHARAVSALLEKEADGIGAEQVSTTIGSEEVSKTIVDTEARIRAREQLRDRLTDVLRTRKGSVAELVEAERQVAAVNEEIDQARSWLAETRGRVSFSRMDVDYRSQAGAGSAFLAPITAAASALSPILGFAIAALLLLAAVLVPIGGVVWAGRRIRRRLAAPTT